MSLKKKTPESTYSVKSFGAVALCLLTSLSAEFLFQHFIGAPRLASALGRILIVFLSLVVIQSYSAKSMLRFRPEFRDLLLVHLILISSIFILWFGRMLSIALTDYLLEYNSFAALTPQALRFAVPFTFGGLLISTVKGLNYGLVLAISFSIIVGYYLPDDILMIPYVLVTTLIACISISNLRSRSTYLKAGLKIGLISIPFSLVPLLFQDTLVPMEIIFRVICPVFGGLLAVAIAALLSPALEYLGGYVTDLRLIEMSTLDHPLLKQLSVQAPGTWNHSMVLGMMVEAAADEVGANPVLSRVGAYFHDIGKSKKPLYFVENQKGSENRHDRLSPSMSALIIRSHVKDGAEMAREQNVPQAIIDLIQQHHGTSTIEYFYKKACKEAEESDEGTEVDKSLYTYPGPKPQTREAGILMLADVIESSSRTLPDLSLDRIQMHVQKMINKIFSSGQLEESELTLRDLHKTARAFTRVLNGIHHERIAYDEQAEKQLAKKNGNGKDKKETSEKAIEEQKADEDNLKRLGLEEYT